MPPPGHGDGQGDGYSNGPGNGPGSRPGAARGSGNSHGSGSGRGGRPPNAPGYPPPRRPVGFGPPDDPYREAGDEDEPARVVPTGLRRHQRRLLVQTGLILAAMGGLCWWAVYSLSDGHPHASAAGSTHPDTSPAPPGTGAAGLTVPGSSPTVGPAGGASATGKAPANSAPATATGSVPDTTTATSVQATLLGGSGSVPQIVVLVTVHTAGTGTISVTAAYYGRSGAGGEVAAESQTWTLTGQTTYQYSVPIANSPYCGTTFHLTLRAGGRSSSASTSPGC